MNLLQGLGTCEQSHLSKMTWQRIKPWPLSQFCTPEISRSEIWSILGLGDCWNLLLHQKPQHYRRDKTCCYGARHNCFPICLAFSTEWHPSNTSKPPSAEQNHGALHAQHRQIPLPGRMQHIIKSQLVPPCCTDNALQAPSHSLEQEAWFSQDNLILGTLMFKFLTHTAIWWGHTVAQLVEALCYKLEGHGFDSRWCH
jgi:hypothetical protein